MVETSARLLRLLSLLGVRPEWTGAELAGRLAVTPRTLRRDIARLRSLGYPVHATPGVPGGYRLGAGAALPPLLLDDDEAVAVALSLRSAPTQSVTGVGEASLRALAKLEQVLPSRLRERAAAISQATVPLSGPVAAVDPETLITIARACRNCERLEFSYRGRDGEARAPGGATPPGPGQLPLVPGRTGRGQGGLANVQGRPDRGGGQSAAGSVPQDPPDAAGFVARAVTTAP